MTRRASPPRSLIAAPRLLLVLTLGAVSSSSMAAEPADGPGTNVSPSLPRRLEEIIITAQRTEQKLQDVPISVFVLDGDTLRNEGMVRIYEAMKLVPNVYVPDSGAIGNLLVIRGFGTPFGVSAFDPEVGLAVDELPLNQDVYFGDPIFDIERFEVLRGPQGTLFGRNTSAGLFNVTTGNPTDELGGYLIGRVGGLGARSFEGAAGGPLGSLGKLAEARLAVLASNQAEDVLNTKRNEKSGAEQLGARLKLALEPLQPLHVLLTAERIHTESDWDIYQLHRLSESSLQFLRRYDPRVEGNGFNHQESENFPNAVDRTSDRLQAEIRLDGGQLGPLAKSELIAVAGYSGYRMSASQDVDGSPADIYIAPTVDADYDQRSAELRGLGTISLPWGEMDLLFGLLFFDSHFVTPVEQIAGADIDDWVLSAPGFEALTGAPAPGGIGFEDLAAAAAALGVALPPGPNPSFVGDGYRGLSDQHTVSMAGYGQLAWRPSERWTLNLGGRLTDEAKHAHVRLDCTGFGAVCAASLITEYDLRLHRHDTAFSPRVALQYFPFDGLSLFATRTTGFKSGGFNNRSFTADRIAVRPEHDVSWEAGAKGTLFDGTLAYGATFFDTEIDDLQLVRIFARGLSTLTAVQNAASARSRGVELDSRWQTPLRPLSLALAGAFTDARFRRYPNAPGPPTGATPQDLSGHRLPFVPEWQLNATPRLDIPFATAGLPLLGAMLPDRLAFTAAVDLLYRSDLDPNLDFNARQEPAHVLVDARIGISTVDSSWSLVLAGTNLTDAGVAQISDSELFFPGSLQINQIAQRNWSLALRHTF